MADGTKIEWAANADGSPGASWNPIRARNRADGRVGWFCVHASGGCKLCYAERINHRLGTGIDYAAQNEAQVEVFLDEKALLQPLRWKKPRTIFVCSMTDLFGAFSPEGDVFGPCESSDLRVGADCVGMSPVGKRAAGRMLDGRTHDERPPLAHLRAPS